jgi:RNA polymerase sporulation-specific sigma factor
VVLALIGSMADVVVNHLMVLLGGFVTNSSTFPQPLNEADEAMYLAKLQRGDDEARAILIERNLRLVAHIVKKFDNTGEETDDLISIGTAGRHYLQPGGAA